MLLSTFAIKAAEKFAFLPCQNRKNSQRWSFALAAAAAIGCAAPVFASDYEPTLIATTGDSVVYVLTDGSYIGLTGASTSYLQPRVGPASNFAGPSGAIFISPGSGIPGAIVGNTLAFGGSGISDQATYWTTPGNPTALAAPTTPPGTTSFNSASGVSPDGTQFIGSTSINSVSSALLWTSSGATPVSLTPNGFTGSTGISTDGTNEVINATDSSGVTHGLVIAGASTSYTDLTSSVASLGFNYSSTAQMNGNYVVGVSGIYSESTANPPVITQATYATLWTKEGGSYVATELGPQNSRAALTNGVVVAGTATVGGNETAVEWDIATGAMTYLNTLPDGQALDTSTVNSIDAAGDIFGSGTIGDTRYVIEWSSTVPEPASVVLLGVSAAGVMMRRRRTSQ
jgi:hypothetical protein